MAQGNNPPPPAPPPPPGLPIDGFTPIAIILAIYYNNQLVDLAGATPAMRI